MHDRRTKSRKRGSQGKESSIGKEVNKMPRGSGLYQKLMEKRRELEKAIADIDAVARVVRGGKAGSRGGRARKPMSEEQKHKISVAATKRHAQARAKDRKSTRLNSSHGSISY